MLRKIYLMVAFALITTFAFAQTGTLKGVITDVMSGEPIPFANVVAERNGNQIGGTTTDFGVIKEGFPRESSIPVDIGGVRTNFRMPDLISIPAGPVGCFQ